MSRTVDNFVDTVRTRGPRLQDIELLEAQGRDALKARAMEDLGQIQTFLGKVQDMILDGCIDDFQLIAEQPEYEAVHALIHGSKGGAAYWDMLVREAVREQVEIEVYVPLRSVVSRWLVNGWRHEDMEVQFRIKELRRRPQEFFRITKGEKRHDWSSVSEILNEKVGLSTLPCVKLRAIVDAAREIFRIFSQQQQDQSTCVKPQSIENKVETGHLGADDFLPIFIYCVVQAEMERPCALCVLLRTLCDRINKIGEIGYYLLTFEAAIKHCEEVDLTEDREEMPSFLSIPLDDN
jgi:Vacuolar sorting protein 9 (VPS9) domain